MLQWERLESEELVTIIRRIKMESRTGQLFTQRGERGIVEEGIIVFVNGKMTDAQCGRRAKSDAFNYLSRWSKCKYLFLAQDATQKKIPSSQLHHYIVTSLPSPTRTDTQPLARPSSANVDNPLSSASTGPFSLSNAPSIMAYHTCQFNQGLYAIERSGLTREHRRIFLLIDGKRSVEELARLMVVELQEVYKLLQELQRVGVVHIERHS